jgi:hypothetical protein
MKPSHREVDETVVVREGYGIDGYGLGYECTRQTVRSFSRQEGSDELAETVDLSVTERVNVNKMVESPRGFFRKALWVGERVLHQGDVSELSVLCEDEPIPEVVKQSIEDLPLYVADVLKAFLSK